MKEVEELTAQLCKQQQQSQQTAQELEQLRKVHTHTHTVSQTLVSQRACPLKRLGLVMAALQLQQHLSLRQRAVLAHSTGAAVCFPLVETYRVQQCTWDQPGGLTLSCVHIVSTALQTCYY